MRRLTLVAGALLLANLAFSGCRDPNPVYPPGPDSGTGGIAATGGASSTGGNAATGGLVATGGATTTGGAMATGGQSSELTPCEMARDNFARLGCPEPAESFVKLCEIYAADSRFKFDVNCRIKAATKTEAKKCGPTACR